MPNDLSVWSMVLDASPIVQAVVALLLLASVMSWAIIFRKSRVISNCRRTADQFESQFWSGGDLAALYRNIETKGRAGTGLQSIFESGFGEFSRLRQLGTAADLLARGLAARNARRADARDGSAGAQSRDARDGGLDEPVRGSVRHRLGHHDGLPQPRQRAASDAVGRRAGYRRGPHHHGHRTVRSHSRGHRIQPVRRPGEPPGTSLRHLCRRVFDHSAAPWLGRVRTLHNACRLRCVVAN